MTTVPVISNFQGDFVLQLVSIDTDDTMDEVAAAAAHHSLNRRVKAQPDKTLRVRVQGNEEPLPQDMTVAQAGIEPMVALEIYYEN